VTAAAAPIAIGIDLGTSGCRACAIDGTEQVLGFAQVPLPEPDGAPPCREQDPALWWPAVTEVLAALLASVPAQAVRAIAVDGTSGSLLVCDRAGAPRTAALMYNDARSTAAAAAVACVAPAMSGAHGATSGLAKLLHLLAGGVDLAGGWVSHQADWISGRLTGRWGVTDENNALKLGYDVLTRCWPAWLDALGVPCASLPRVVPPGTPLGPLDPTVARRLGLPAQVTVVAGTTDSIAAFLATGARQPGEAVTALGSTLALKVVSPRPVFDPPHGVYSHRLGALWLAGGASNSGGAVLRRYFSQAQLDALTPMLEPDVPTGLDYYPLRAPGERFPIADPNLAPRLDPRPPDERRFFQGLLEGIAAIERAGYDRLAQAGAPYPRSVRTTGGGARNTGWNAIRRRLLGVPLVPAAHSEAAFGSALLAHWGSSGRVDAISIAPTQVDQ
jgi:sugar (pentulose or hexulose) kinase